MRLINELLCQELGRDVTEHFKICDIGRKRIVKTEALHALREIRTIIYNNELAPFIKADKIEAVFRKYHIDMN